MNLRRGVHSDRVLALADKAVHLWRSRPVPELPTPGASLFVPELPEGPRPFPGKHLALRSESSATCDRDRRPRRGHSSARAALPDRLQRA